MDERSGATETAKRTGSRPGVIVVARHGRPKGDRRVRIDWRGYIDWWAQYDRDGLSPGQTPPQALVDLAAASHVVFASSLQRAIETAQAVAPGRAIVIDPIFVEAPLPPPPIPGKRRAKDWGVWARAAWWFGRSAGQESRPEAERRAEAAVATLTARALRGENVLLCAHGWFNRMLRPILQAQGWRCVEDRGDKYWSHRRYEKVR